jgi:Bax protein
MKNKIVLSAIAILVILTATLLSAPHKERQKHYSASIIPKNMSVQEKKARFYALIIPAINEAYKELEAQYKETKKLIDNDPKSPKLVALMQSYHAKDLHDLLVRMKLHPRSIVIAQAAMESAWATSRFFREGKNIFGVWSYKADEPRIAAGIKRGKTTIYLKKYNSLVDSVKDYYKTIAIKKIFSQFRAHRMQTQDPYVLVKYLNKYSERGDEYCKEIASMIRHNHLTQYDK